MEDDLTWLARNVHEWKDGCKFVYVLRSAQGVFVMWLYDKDSVCQRNTFTSDQWLSRRAELQNKPSWADAPEWAEYIAQDKSGAWWFFGCQPEAMSVVWDVDSSAYHHSSWIDGEVLGDWRDTLERRPEKSRAEMEVELVKAAFEPFVSVEDGASQAGTDALAAELIRRLEGRPEKFGTDVLAILSSAADREIIKRDAAVCGGEGYLNNHWFERGELPPVGVRCEALITSERQWVEIDVVCHRDGYVLGWCMKEKCGYHGDEPTDFRPIRTERDLAIDEMKACCPNHGSWDSVGRIYAEALYDAGYRKQK